MTWDHTPRGLLPQATWLARLVERSLLREGRFQRTNLEALTCIYSPKRLVVVHFVCTWLRDARGCGWRVVGCCERLCVVSRCQARGACGNGRLLRQMWRTVWLVRALFYQTCDEDTSLKLLEPWPEATHAAMPSPLPRGARRGAIGAIQQAGEAAAASSAEQASHRSTPTRAAGLAVAERRNACEGGCLSCRGLIR